MLYILSGEDDFSLKEALAEIKRSTGEYNSLRLDGSKVSPSEFEAAVATMPFLSEKRLVIVDGLLEYLATVPEDKLKKWFDIIRHLPPTTELVLIEKGKSSPRELLPEDITAEIRVFHPLKGKELKKWVTEQFKKRGADISPQALDTLLWLSGNDLWSISGEIDKLIIFADGRPIEEDDVKMLVSESQQITIFELVDTIIKGGEAQHALVKLTSSGANPNYILFMLARQIRLLLRIKALEASGATEGEIRQKLAISSDFAWQKTKYLSQRYSLDELKEVYQRLLETDRSIKSGQCDPELALHLLVAELRLKTP